jgi:rubrerythrin
MATLEASETQANLRVAFATEILASRRYQAYSERAEAEGNAVAAALFRIISRRRCANADAHLEALEPPDTKSTAYHLRVAMMEEDADLYPGMARKARDEGLEEIALWFETLAKAGRMRTNRFRRVLETMM